MAKAKTEETAIAKIENTEIQPGRIDQSAAVAEFGYSADEIGAGFEHQTGADVQIPFLVLLQALSPIVVDGKELGGLTARPGMWYNTVTEQVWDKEQGFLFVPATTRHYWVEWVPRNQGGGFRGHHQVTDKVIRDALAKYPGVGKKKTEEGNELVETFYVYGAICGEDGSAESPALIAFSSTKIRAYKGWQTRMRIASAKVNLPLYSNLVRITSESKENEHGRFFIPVIKAAHPDGIPASRLLGNDERVDMAKYCRDMVESDRAKVDFNKQNAQGNSEEETPF